MSPVVSAPICKEAEQIEAAVLTYGKATATTYSQLRVLKNLKHVVAVEYLKSRFPADYSNWKSSQTARESLLACEVVPTKTCERDRNRWLLESDPKRGERFLERVATLTKGPQFRRLQPGAEPTIIDGLTDGFKAALGTAYRKRIETNTGQKSPADYSAYQNEYMYLDDKLASIQASQKSFLNMYQKSLSEAAKRILNHPDMAALKKRYEQIRSCETTPINGPISSSQSK
jgi:hypothetical protein